MDIPFPDLEETYPLDHSHSVSKQDISSQKINRPKSVPVDLNSGKISNNATHGLHAPPASYRSHPSSATTDCSRLVQLEQYPRRKKLSSGSTITNGLKRSSKPGWLMHYEPDILTPCIVGPGYVLSRSKSKLHVQLYEAGAPRENKEKAPQVMPKSVEFNSAERDSLIALLQHQIEDLMLKIEEERLNHKETKRLASEHLKVKIDDLAKHYTSEIEALEVKHSKKLASMLEGHVAEMVDCQNQCEEDIKKHRREIELLQSAFEAFKLQLMNEINEKLGRRLNEMSLQLKAEAHDQMQELRAQLTSEKLAEKADIENAYQEKISRLKCDHKQQILELKNRYSENATDMERMKETEASLLETQKELDQLQDVYQNKSLQLDGCRMELDQMKMKVIEWENRFDGRIREIDARYKQEVDEGKKQLSELRILYIKKCSEFLDLKHSSNVSLNQRVLSAKEVMKVVIETRARTALSLTSSSDPELERIHRKPKTRSSSAPLTRSEVDRATVNAGITTAETKHLDRFG